MKDYMWEVYSTVSVKETNTQGYATCIKSKLVIAASVPECASVWHLMAPSVRNTSEWMKYW